jgi:hypothetical protein
MNFEKFEQHLNGIDAKSKPIGFGVHHFLLHFNSTFSQSGEKLFTEFLNSFSYVKKWIIASDYVFGDRKKPNDTVVFSIIPYLANLNDINHTINDMAPTDIKKTKRVTDEFLKFLSDGPVFNICIQLDRQRKLYADEREYHQSKIESIISQLEYWCESTPEGRSGYLQSIKKFRNAGKLMQSPGINLKTFRDIEVVSTLAAYLMAKTASTIDIEFISWLSDRDAMLDFKTDKLGHYMLDCTRYLYHSLCVNCGVNNHGKALFGLPEREGKMWYDSINRIPDLLAGTFADYEYELNKLSHKKYVPIVEKLFSAEKRNLFFRIDFNPKLKSSRLTWSVKHDVVAEDSLSIGTSAK